MLYCGCQCVFSCIAFGVLVTLGLGCTLLLPAQCLGFPVLAYYFRAVDTFAAVDIRLARWMSPHICVRPMETFELSASISTLLKDARAHGIWRSLVYFVLLKIIMEVAGFLAVSSWIANALAFISVPILWLAGVPDMCFNALPYLRLTMRAECTGVK